MLDGLSLFFPCHNEEANVDNVITEALRIAPTVASAFEIIIVDDGSTDRTQEIVKKYLTPGSSVRTVRHDRCLGYGAAVRSGIQACRFPWIFFSDGDLQFDLQELPRLVEKSGDADIVSGYRSKRADPWHRKLNSWIYEQALNVLIGLHIRDVNCAFKLFRRTVFDRMELRCSGALINAEIFAKARQKGCRVVTVSVSHRPRTAGQATGAQFRVIFRAMREFILLWRDVRASHGPK
jgi:glycosyltransferase involved in cell wall biosynthesis